jgi:hypothetical protein
LPARDAPIAVRSKAYEEYRLRESGNAFFGHSWQRADGEYELDELDPLLDISPATRARRSEIETRTWILVPSALAGGALLGIALGDDLFHGYGLSRSARTGFYIAGGTLSAATIAVSLAWDPVSGLGDLYNHALSERLSLGLGTTSTEDRKP